MANLLIIMAVLFDCHLHTPMYFFLMNLAVLDIGSISVLVPKAMANSLMDSRTISYFGCVAQVFLLLFFVGSDFALLTVMAHDRYVAICNPLQYEKIMHKRACIKMVVSAWISGVLNSSLNTGSTFAITFCSNVVHQFFCEIPQLLKLSCSGLDFVQIGVIVLTCGIVQGCFIFIILTYVKIFATVLKIPSVQSQKKALSTCIPHLTVVFLLVFSGIFAYGSSMIDTSSVLNIVFAFFYAILPPFLNPFIYTMRNKEIKTALLKLFTMANFSKIISSRVVL
ncbi:olfactory receptor 14C36-like [Heteronotia binoei]|uniref:olfactory receptor 14C36-like n=1 Tax=Heteronotia binoei TaxID=13085 RepID=UPI00292E1983|nr:olfactory receptor 14C36-like [Heteronotia binoei]